MKTTTYAYSIQGPELTRCTQRQPLNQVARLSGRPENYHPGLRIHRNSPRRRACPASKRLPEDLRDRRANGGSPVRAAGRFRQRVHAVRRDSVQEAQRRVRA